MKKLLFVFLSLLLNSFLPLKADNCLQNGDFTDGTAHWYGDGILPSEFNSSNPLAPTKNPITQGLVIPLKTMSWSKITQEFQTNATDLSLTITYTVSPDFAFSDKPSYYTNIPPQIEQKRFSPFSIDTGLWLAIFCDKGKNVFEYYKIKPPEKPDGPITFTSKLGGFIPHQDKTLILAFPPGSGFLVLQSVVVSN